MLVFNETELQLFTTSTWLGEIYITNCFKSSEPSWKEEHKDSFVKMLTSLHRSVDFSRELCTPLPLKLASHVISHKPEVLDVNNNNIKIYSAQIP